MSRWHSETCQAPKITLDNDNVPRCHNCSSSPPLEKLIAAARRADSLPPVPPDEPLGRLNLRWPPCVRYTDGENDPISPFFCDLARGVGGEEAFENHAQPSATDDGGVPSDSTTGDKNLSLALRLVPDDPLEEDATLDSTVYGSQALTCSEFRLLCLSAPRNPDEAIHCDLETHPFDDCPEYEAVSYAWGGEKGDSSKRCPVFVGPYWDVLLQTQNCWDMLKHMRPSRGERLIWVDAICINQLNKPERGQQVSNMAQVYSKAMRVVVYLGPDIAPPLNERRNPSRKSLLMLPMESSADKAHGSPLSLTSILGCRYFSRLWIIQELILSQCILMRISDTDFCAGRESFGLPSHVDIQEVVKSSPAPWFRYLAGRRFPRRHLLEVLSLTWKSMAGDARDKIFGVLGLLGGTGNDDRLLAWLDSHSRLDPEPSLYPMGSGSRLDRQSALYPEDLATLDAEYTISTLHVFIGTFAYVIMELVDTVILRAAGGIATWGRGPSWVPVWDSDIQWSQLGTLIDGDQRRGWACGGSAISATLIHKISLEWNRRRRDVVDIVPDKWKRRRRDDYFVPDIFAVSKAATTEESARFPESQTREVSFDNWHPSSAPEYGFSHFALAELVSELDLVELTRDLDLLRELEVRSSGWRKMSPAVHPGTGGLRTNAMHLMPIMSVPIRADIDVAGAWPHCYEFPGKASQASIYVVSAVELDRIIQPGRDHVFVVYHLERNRYSALILRPFCIDSKPDVSRGLSQDPGPAAVASGLVKSWRIVAVCPRLLLASNVSASGDDADDAEEPAWLESYEYEDISAKSQDVNVTARIWQVPLEDIGRTLHEVLSSTREDLRNSLRSGYLDLDDDDCDSKRTTWAPMEDHKPRKDYDKAFKQLLGVSGCTPANVLKILQTLLDEEANKLPTGSLIRELLALADPILEPFLDGDIFCVRLAPGNVAGLRKVPGYWRDVRDLYFKDLDQEIIPRCSFGASPAQPEPKMWSQVSPKPGGKVHPHGARGCGNDCKYSAVIGIRIDEAISALREAKEYKWMRKLNTSSRGSALEVMAHGPSPEDRMRGSPLLPNEIVDDLRIDGKTCQICIV